MDNTFLLIRNIAPCEFGGSEIYQIAIAKILKENHIDPVIITASKTLLKKAKELDIKTIEAPYITRQNWSGWRNFLVPLYFLKQRKLIKFYRRIYKEYQPFAVNIQSRDEQIAATVAAKKTGIKVFWTDHADYRNWVLWNIDKPFKNFIGKKIVRLAKGVEAIIAISDYEKAFIKNAFKKTNPKIIVVKNGVTDEKAKYEKEKILKNSLCFIGRLVEDKGINELLEAYEAVRTNNPNISLHICGDGTLYKKLKQEYRNDKTIHFYGYIDNISQILARSEFFILPSHKEGLSLSLIQAAMMEKTIIATNVGASPEIIKNNHNGILIEAQSKESIKLAIEYVLEHPAECKKMAQNVRKTYLDEFILSKNIEQYLIPLLSKH